MTLRGTMTESYITEYTLVYEDKTTLTQNPKTGPEVQPGPGRVPRGGGTPLTTLEVTQGQI